jgi:hypothetical protein
VRSTAFSISHAWLRFSRSTRVYAKPYPAIVPPLTVLPADTLAAIAELRADARAAAEPGRAPAGSKRLAQRFRALEIDDHDDIVAEARGARDARSVHAPDCLVFVTIAVVGIENVSRPAVGRDIPLRHDMCGRDISAWRPTGDCAIEFVDNLPTVQVEWFGDRRDLVFAVANGGKVETREALVGA